MTAIAAYVETDGVRIFADGGHYRDGRLARIVGKLHYLPRINGVVTLTGPSDAARRLAALIETKAATLEVARDILLPVARQTCGENWSAMLFGAMGGLVVARGAEPSGRIVDLAPGQALRTFPAAPIGSDEDAIEAFTIGRQSGLPIGGFLQAMRVNDDGMESRTLVSWRDHPEVSGATVQAQIGELTVDTLRIADGAVTIIETGTSSITISNPKERPIRLIAKCRGYYKSVQTSSAGSVTVTFKRTRDNKVLWTETKSWSGNTGGAFSYWPMACAVIDLSATSSETYTLTWTYTQTGPTPLPTVGVDSLELAAIAVKK